MNDPLLENSTVIALGRKALEDDPGTVVYADSALRPPGHVQVGAETVRTEHPTLLVFRDEMPGANWMHPCTYALVDVETQGVLARVPSDRPPTFGTLPESWVVVSDTSS